MVSDASEPLDEPGDPRQGPELGRKAVGPRPGAQCPLDWRQVGGRQLRFAPRPAGSLEPAAPLGLPGVVPVVRADP